jgi:uncharacterized phage-associated protein
MNEYIEGQRPYTSIAIANELLKRAKEADLPITHLKLQKLVYFSHALCLALEKKPLIRDEVQAWRYGPVIPDLFRECAKYGKKEINDYISSTAIKTGDGFLDLEFVPSFIDKKDKFSNSVLDAIIEIYGSKTAGQLSNMAHAKNSAWELTKEYHQEGAKRGYIIPIELIGEAEKERFGIQDETDNLECSK